MGGDCLVVLWGEELMWGKEIMGVRQQPNGLFGGVSIMCTGESCTGCGIFIMCLCFRVLTSFYDELDIGLKL